MKRWQRICALVMSTLSVFSTVLSAGCNGGGTSSSNSTSEKKHSHIWSTNVVTEATCTEKGLKRRFCEECQEEEFEEIAPGHSIVRYAAQEVTCTNVGWDAYEACENCDYTTQVVIEPLAQNYVDEKCTSCGQDIPDCVHGWGEYEISVEPTCFATGLKTRECELCGDIEIVEIPVAHNLMYFEGEAATCTYSGWTSGYICLEECGYYDMEEIPSTGHKYVDDVCVNPGCGERDYTKTTINIKVRRAGFGTDWLYELKAKFEEAYAAEGYKVNIWTPDNSIKDDVLIKELALGYDKTKVDLYISSGATPEKVGENGDYGVLVEEISDLVYNQKAIAYSGAEETKTVGEKISQDVIPYMTDSTGKIYAYNWAQTSGGLVVNTRKLAKYGLEQPKTTNEMFDCFEKIYLGYNGIGGSMETSTYPITYVSGTNGYALCFMYGMMAQYDIDFFNQYWSFTKKNDAGETVAMTDEECQALYNHPALVEMLEVSYRAFDVNIAAPGSLSNTVDQAQAKIMGDVDDAVFMFNGDWMLNEVKLNYPDELNDIDFCNYPVVSAVGTKLFGANTAYGFDEAKCDELLSYIIGLVDENKSIEEIVADVAANKGITITEADAQEVARARGVSYSRGVEHVAYVTKGTPKKDIVGLFLRMMSSNDFGETFNRTANGTSPYFAQVNTTSPYLFVRNASKIPANNYFSLISLFTGARGYRGQLNRNSMFVLDGGNLCSYIAERSMVSIYNWDGGKRVDADESVYEKAAQNFLTSELTELKKNWQNYKDSAGLW